MDNTARILAAADYIRSRVNLRPEIGLILGSGLGDFADTLEDALRIPYAEIPRMAEDIEVYAEGVLTKAKRD